ncbi:hypothetical protein K3X41_08230 [Aliiroseovarius crassostreae]|uniref:hypothetical protein n=1 Tax=Aliiroseovarius crassostreae TaxID=154981 RepID=UPI00220AAE61|nr:hypothetical protein [Aliiroseovarius crassostreae]UWQ06837.1 hypothetical protein K3X25_08370 [Aliiroseovarius crassostreae]UWQ09939.1 hypothetical protein K3X41_08230 [Aliiroseovarius crassostreae]
MSQNPPNILPKIEISDIIAHASIQESLLQTYRSIFLSIEIALVTVATFVITQIEGSTSVVSYVPFFGLLLLAIAFALILLPVISSRGKFVYYWQSLLIDAEAGIEVYSAYSNMKLFQGNSAEAKAFQKEFCARSSYQALAGKPGITRKKLDHTLPWCIAFTWGALVLTIILSFN